jgi:hypothetical protein
MPNITPASPILGRLSLDSLPLHEPILLGTFIAVLGLGIALLAVLTRYRLWGYLWREWLTSVDHKRVGIMQVQRFGSDGIAIVHVGANRAANGIDLLHRKSGAVEHAVHDHGRLVCMIDPGLCPGRKGRHVMQVGRGKQYIIIERDMIG